MQEEAGDQGPVGEMGRDQAVNLADRPPAAGELEEVGQEVCGHQEEGHEGHGWIYGRYA